MIFKIKKLVIDNFKIFDHCEFNFEFQTLAMLDGPNGYGKTSFYDALELLLTGTVQRYEHLERMTVDKRKLQPGYPLLNDESRKGYLSIKAEIETRNSTILIARMAPKNKLDKVMGLGEYNMPLYQIESFEDNQNKQLIDDDQVFFKPYMGNSYKKNFHLFQYIVQEDNTAIFKSKATSKQEKIDHLFDVGDYRDKLNQIEKIKKIIATLRTQAKKNQLQSLEKEIKQFKKSDLSETQQVDYKRIVFVTEQPWDKEQIEFDTPTIAKWISDVGILSRIKVLKEHSENYFNSLFNEDLRKSLLPRPEALENLLRFVNKIEFINVYKNDLRVYEIVNQYLNFVEKDLINSIKSDHLEIKSELIKLLPDEFRISEYNQRLEELKTLIDSSGKIQISIAKLKNSRAEYIEDFKSHQAQRQTTTFCPTCGYDWKNHVELLKQINRQGELLESAAQSTATVLNEKINQFKTDFINIIVQKFKKYLDIESPQNHYKISICELNEKQLQFLESLKNNYVLHNIGLSEFYVKTLDLNEDLKTDELQSMVEKKYRPVDYSVIFDDFDEHFQQVFNNNEEALNSLTFKDIEEKKTYLQFRYVKAVTSEVDKKEALYNEAKLTYDNADKLDKMLKILKEIYNKNLNQYISSVTKGIEILFHIYSGRLLQNSQNGLGVFIDTDGKSISFKENPNKNHDLIFSMSSGQLSSLVIAFVLALNNRYAKNELLLIDDPVQSLDEINIAGFVDLLRNEFSDRQIFLATHEDHISSYIRYKFEKMNLKTQRINFREKVSGIH